MHIKIVKMAVLKKEYMKGPSIISGGLFYIRSFPAGRRNVNTRKKTINFNNFDKFQPFMLGHNDVDCIETSSLHIGSLTPGVYAEKNLGVFQLVV